MDGDWDNSNIYDVYVKGSMYVKGGSIEVTNKLVVEKDLRMQAKGGANDKDGDGYGETGGIMNLRDGSKLTVHGDFYTQSLGDHNFAYTTESAAFELRGNFKQIGTNTCFNHNNMVKITFAGNKDQNVSFDRCDSFAQLGKIHIENANKTISFSTPVYGAELLHDTTIKGINVEIKNLKLNGYTATIDGNFILHDAVNDGKLVVSKDLTVAEDWNNYGIYDAVVKGNMYVYGGSVEVTKELIVEKDLRIQKKLGADSYIETGGLMNLHDGSKLTVYGDFYTQSLSDHNFAFTTENSVFELHGDFKQVGTNTCFSSNNMVNIIFAGDEDQHVSFDRCDGFAQLGRIQVQNANNRVWFDTPVRVVELMGDATIKGEDVEIIDFNINGYTATIDGNFVLNDGNQIIMNNNSDALIINGDLYNNSWMHTTIERGILELKGNYIQTVLNAHFGTGLNAYMQLTGDNKQLIQFPQHSTVYFHNLLIKQPQTNYFIENGTIPTFSFNQTNNIGGYNKIWNTLYEENYITVNPSVQIIQDTNTIRVTGQVIENSSMVIIELKYPNGDTKTTPAILNNLSYVCDIPVNPVLDGTYEVTVTADNMAATPCRVFKLGDLEDIVPLTAVSIKGTATVGNTLTATVVPQGAIATYQWKRNGEDIDDATSSTYTLVEDDLGQTITVVATGSGSYTGSVTADVTINALTTSAPAQPIVSSSMPPTATSLTVNSISAPTGWTTQYRIRTGSTGTWGIWQNSNTFTGLNATTDYQVQAWFKANNTATHVDSPESVASDNIRTAMITQQLSDVSIQLSRHTVSFTRNSSTPYYRMNVNNRIDSSIEANTIKYYRVPQSDLTDWDKISLVFQTDADLHISYYDSDEMEIPTFTGDTIIPGSLRVQDEIISNSFDSSNGNTLYPGYFAKTYGTNGNFRRIKSSLQNVGQRRVEYIGIENKGNADRMYALAVGNPIYTTEMNNHTVPRTSISRSDVRTYPQKVSDAYNIISTTRNESLSAAYYDIGRFDLTNFQHPNTTTAQPIVVGFEVAGTRNNLSIFQANLRRRNTTQWTATNTTYDQTSRSFCIRQITPIT